MWLNTVSPGTKNMRNIICISKFINYCASVSRLNIVTSGIHFHILRQQEKIFFQSVITEVIYWKTLFACNEKLTENNTHTSKAPTITV